jgi:hypothetical protein
MVWSAIFIPIEIALDAPGYALMQAGLFVAAAALLWHQTRAGAPTRPSLPPPAGHAASRPPSIDERTNPSEPAHHDAHG